MEDHRVYALVVAAVFLWLSWVSVGLRCYTRLVVKRQFGADDIYAILALLAFTVCGVLQLLAVQNGFGEHSWTLVPVQIARILKHATFSELCYIISACLVKISFGITILRVTTIRSHVYTIYSLMTTVTLFSIVYAILLLLQCQPLSLLWQQLLGATGGQCEYFYFYYATYVHSIIILIANITLAIIPILLVLPLELNLRTKVAITGLLALGSTASVATVARIPWIPSIHDTNDFAYSTTPMAIWTTVECGISIIASAASTFRPLLQKSKRFALNTPSCGPHVSGNLGKLRPFKLGSGMNTLSDRPKLSVNPHNQKKIRIANEKRIEALKEFPISPPQEDKKKEQGSGSESRKASNGRKMVSRCTASKTRTSEGASADLDWEEAEEERGGCVEKDVGQMV